MAVNNCCVCGLCIKSKFQVVWCSQNQVFHRRRKTHIYTLILHFITYFVTRKLQSFLPHVGQWFNQPVCKVGIWQTAFKICFFLYDWSVQTFCLWSERFDLSDKVEMMFSIWTLDKGGNGYTFVSYFPCVVLETPDGA